MQNIKSTIILFISVASLSMLVSCKKQLDVKNPNQPTLASASTETGVISLAQGGVYIAGFTANGLPGGYYDGVVGAFWDGAVGFHELMGDEIGQEAANAYLNQIGCPFSVTLDNSTVIPNPNSPQSQLTLLRQINLNGNLGQNPLYYEWTFSYNINNTCNSILSIVDNVAFSGDANTKINTIKAWCYWWKGYAYSRIGSIYYAGLINDTANSTNANFLAKEKIIAEANSNFDKASSILSGLTENSDYDDVLGKLIPQIFQVGKGGILSPAMWIRNINTFEARNILVNTRVKDMTSAQWASIASLTSNGVQVDDLVFTGRSNDNGDFISASDGTVAARATGNPGSISFPVSERLIQDFEPGDKRLDNNFIQLSTPWIGPSDRGNVFNTRWQLVDGGNGMNGVVVLSNKNSGDYELYLATTYEENQLMAAEAKIYTGDIDGGLTLIDEVRDYQGAGLAHVSGTGLTLDQAKEELRRERRVALAFRGFSFYDARRWGVLDDVSQGGGRTGCVVVDNSGNVNTNATINYNFLDYWDVPDNELAYNPPAAGSDPVKNPK